jgi:deoxyribodipyrimidine photo-lyase
MWFASIWIFTLRLPWALGADFFLRHLMDGDPASNTLSWRWVAGLHTKGKTYLARVSNIAKYSATEFRFDRPLASEAVPLVETVEHPRRAIPDAGPLPDRPYVLLVTEDDGWLADMSDHPPEGVVGLLATHDRSPLGAGGKATAFARGAVRDAVGLSGVPNAGPDGPVMDDWAGAILTAAENAGTRDVVTAYLPVGPVADRMADTARQLREAGVTLHRVRRPYDSVAWPHATRGFFGLKKKIPQILQELGLSG